MKNLSILLALIFLAGCSSIIYDKESQSCRDTKTGKYVVCPAGIQK